MKRVWTVCPSSERIVQDIKRIPTALKRIIEAKGAKVSDLDNRRGRRQSQPVVLHADCDGAIAEREAKWARFEPE